MFLEVHISWRCVSLGIIFELIGEFPTCKVPLRSIRMALMVKFDRVILFFVLFLL